MEQIHQHQQQFALAQQAAERFSQGVADLLLAVEELRQSLHTHSSSNVGGGVTVDELRAWQWQTDHLLSILPHLERWCADATVG